MEEKEEGTKGKWNVRREGLREEGRKEREDTMNTEMKDLGKNGY